MDYEEVLRVKLVNSFLLISLAISVVSAIILPLIGNAVMFCICLCSLVIQLFGVYCSYRGWFKTAKHLSSGLFPVYFIVTVILTGAFIAVVLLSLPFITFTLFLFRSPKVRIFYVGAYSISLILAYGLAQWVEPVYPPVDMHLINAIVMGFTFIAQVGFVHLFLIDLAHNKKELSGKTQQFATLFQRNPYPLFLYEVDQGFVAVNNALCNILKAERQDLIGIKIEEISSPVQAGEIHPRELFPHITKELNFKGHTFFEWIHRDSQSREFPVEVTLAKFPESNMLIGIWRDLTHSKRQEEVINKLLANLEEKNAGLTEIVEMRTQEIEEANKELRRSNQDLEQFAYAVSHDLQEPLKMVGGFVQLLESRCTGSNMDAEGHTFIEYAVAGVDRMSALIKDLLSYSRVGQGELSWKECDLKNLVTEKLQDLSVKIHESNATVNIKALPTKITVEPTLMSMVFHNLINNALKFNRSDKPIIDISIESEADGWVCRVTDNGIGIPEDKRDEIFKVFGRLHGQEEFQGTGIGLAMVKKIIDRHGGSIWVESSTEEESPLSSGTTFAFTLPRDEHQLIPINRKSDMLSA